MQVEETPAVYERYQGVRVGYSRKSLNRRTTELPAPPAPAGGDEVTALRKKLKMSQAIFAATLNVSAQLVQKWERGGCTPQRAELRLIDLLIKEPKLLTGLILTKDEESDEKTATKKKSAGKK